ncbi:hypothetical protein VNO77_19147 [Canavalia gladiata]|uniref:Uncharacterized protein n=1 Tax=Canavalia gladiata TaxID=3824 RepID=A0AAN9LM72_CANGL
MWMVLIARYKHQRIYYTGLASASKPAYVIRCDHDRRSGALHSEHSLDSDPVTPNDHAATGGVDGPGGPVCWILEVLDRIRGERRLPVNGRSGGKPKGVRRRLVQSLAGGIQRQRSLKAITPEVEVIQFTTLRALFSLLRSMLGQRLCEWAFRGQVVIGRDSFQGICCSARSLLTESGSRSYLRSARSRY